MTCQFCGKEEFMPFTCRYCGQQFCGEHRLPENHFCSKLQRGKHQTEMDHGIKKDNLNPSKEILDSMKEPDESITGFKKDDPESHKGLNLKTLFIVLVIVAIVTNVVAWDMAYNGGYDQGLSVGLIHGNIEGVRIGNIVGHTNGYNDGKILGEEEGFEDGYDRGLLSGDRSGFEKGKVIGNNIGFVQGYSEGNKTGYDNYQDSYSKGFNEKGFVAPRNPSKAEMWCFIARDHTDNLRYDDNLFTCNDFAMTVKRNAYEAGFLCYYVYVDIGAYGHAMVAFNTTDSGLIFIEPQNDSEVKISSRETYFRDKILGYKLFL